MSADNLTWKEVLTLVSRGTDLTAQQSHWAMNTLMSGTATDAQIAAFIMGLRVKGETAVEVRGLVDAMLENAVRVDLDRIAVDVVGTGGDGAQTVNISTMAAITVAGAGAPVLKHGNRAISSKSGTADVLENLGVAIDMPPALVAACVADAGIAFCFAPSHHPAMRHAAGVRKELGVPTVFNVLGPLANPGQPASALLGCADARMAPILADVQLSRGLRTIVVRSDEGLDELSTSSTSQIWDVTTDEVRHSVLDPAALGLAPATIEQLRGGDPAYNADVVRAIVSGRSDGNFAAIRDVVALNAAGALVAYDAASGLNHFGDPSAPVAQRIALALPVAYQSLDSGAAATVLNVLISVSQRFALSAG